MINPAQIPDEVVEAAAKAEYEVWRHDCAGELDLDLEMYRLWDQLEPDEQERWCGQSRAAIAAALNSWSDSILMPAELILPLTQDNSNADG